GPASWSGTGSGWDRPRSWNRCLRLPEPSPCAGGAAGMEAGPTAARIADRLDDVLAGDAEIVELALIEVEKSCERDTLVLLRFGCAEPGEETGKRGACGHSGPLADERIGHDT